MKRIGFILAYLRDLSAFDPAPPRWAVGIYALVVGFMAVLATLHLYRVPPPLEVPAQTVILVTMDGVRPYELLNGRDPNLTDVRNGPPIMPFFMEELVSQGVFLGDLSQGSRMGMGNPAGISMSGYQAMFLGGFKPCVTNQCSPLFGDTLFTDIADQFANSTVFLSEYAELCPRVIKPDQAVFMTCDYLKLIQLARPLGSNLVQHPDGLTMDIALSMMQGDGRPEASAALYYIGLNESDVAGHKNDYTHYLWILNRYDRFLRRIWAEVQRRNVAGHPTTLIVTTDHGRGRGEDWINHRWNVPGTAEMWAFAAGHAVAAKGRVASEKRTLFDIRPTVAFYLGLNPGRSIYGEVISEFLP